MLFIWQFEIFFTDLHNIRHSFAKFSFVQFLLKLVPVLKWLPKYSIKDSLAGDLAAGMTVAVMHIPQGNYLCCSKGHNC